jgi:hypothetical protein
MWRKRKNAALPFTVGIRGRCISLDGAPVHMCPRKLQAVAGKRLSNAIGRLMIVARDG